ncbi:hypothetical protein LSCM4_07447 [Leishmania orientalis]|uniref:Uncharacterized protein n=1 Tax=Leishmania orientalis TaxID=2249476 RepID=A0A836H451_9TRYP|nr:hypothetical protein LSCM4_07447 [Leishmania orientalis]
MPPWTHCLHLRLRTHTRAHTHANDRSAEGETIDAPLSPSLAPLLQSPHRTSLSSPLFAAAAGGRVCAACGMPLPLASLVRAATSPRAAADMATANAVTTGSSSSADCYVIVWVEGREMPVYACTAPLPFSGPSTSSSSAASAGLAAVPAVNVVALRRFFAAVALVSSSPPTAEARTDGHQEALPCATPSAVEATVLRASLPQGLVSAFGASPLYYSVAVLASSTAAAVDTELVAWLASSALAALHPDSWATTAPPDGQAHGAVLLWPPDDAPDLYSQLGEYGAAEVGRAHADAAAMENYGAREVLSDSAAQSSLAAVLEGFESCHGSPVAVAISTLLRRCWVPFTVPPPASAASVHMSLAGYFILPHTPCLAVGRSAASSLVPTLHACSGACREALFLLAAFCSRRATDLQQTSSAGTTPLAVLPLGGSSGGGGAVALVAASVGCVHPQTVLYQAVLAHCECPLRGAAAGRAAPYVHYLTTSEVAARGTLWHPGVLRSVWA